jgi:LacI family transcriptional regulator
MNDTGRPAGPGRPTSRDVAQLAGVSHTAVSFVFNGRAAGNLSASTQERIRQAAAQLGYRPDPLARGLRRSRTTVIGLVTDEIASSPFAGRLLRGAMETAWASGHLIVTVDSGGDPDKEDAAVAELLGRRVDGIIYAAMSLRRARVPQGLRHTPAVFANCLPEDDSLPAVIPAERAGGRTAAGLLLEHGHRRVAMIGGQDDIATVERLRGFREALRAEGITVPRPWVLRVGTEMTSGYEGALRLLGEARSGPRPTGIFCYNDRVAAGVLHAAARLGIPVPDRLSVVGYDDQEHMAAFLTPPLTTVALPHRAMGETAAQLLLDSLETGRALPSTTQRIACPPVSRASVGPAPTS